VKNRLKRVYNIRRGSDKGQARDEELEPMGCQGDKEVYRLELGPQLKW
jgi:hypothetical protein